MKEYKSSQWPTNFGLVDTEKFDRYLNEMQKVGWELFSITSTSMSAVLCVFVKEAAETPT